MNPQKEKENLMNTKIITTSKNILILLLVLLSYALQSPAAKQQAELARSISWAMRHCWQKARSWQRTEKTSSP